MAAPVPRSTTREEEASRWMHRGIDLLKVNTPASLEEAVGSFDRAIALRSALPLDENPRHGYGLAAGWINRGDALARLGTDEQAAEAIRSYDEALRLLSALPLEEDPLYPRRLAIAWINRGVARQKENTPPVIADAIRCFREALAVLEDAASAGMADRDLLRAGTLVNLARALLDASNQPGPEARAAAHRALALVKEMEWENPAAAETGLKARHLLCRAIAIGASHGKSIPPELITEATDAVDEGLALARSWIKRGDTGFRALEEDLFRFGCRIYATGQPRFLAEFILESLDPGKADATLPFNREVHEAAVGALWNALTEIQRHGFPSPSTPQFRQWQENLRDLRVTEERLEQLRQAAAA
jgi:tetratricopeptide (TPR) repeat protein